MERNVDWVTIPGGEFTMGSDAFYPEEAPPHRAHVAPFRIARTPVTNREFAEFVDDTGYVTLAEISLSESEFPQLTEADRQAGSLVFTQAAGPVDLRDWRQWWRWQVGAWWREPFGPGTDISGREEHPVIHIAYADACAYAKWVGGRLPTEAEHEFASQGPGPASTYPWGEEREIDGVIYANTWRGKFPYLNEGSLGWQGTSPVGSFPANGYGLYDCIGNVWEWTSTLYTQNHRERAQKLELQGVSPQAPAASACQCSPQKETAMGAQVRVLKGGSHLCAPEYCHRYRSAARSQQTDDSASTHIGFRVAQDIPEPGSSI